MNIFNSIKQDIISVIKAIARDLNINNDDFEHISCEAPRNPEHGEVSTNAAMILAKIFMKTPKDLAQIIIVGLSKYSYIENCQIAGSGFINFNIRADLWLNIIDEILEKNINFGDCNLGQHKKVNIEYVSANPTGPMHIGHARNAVIGDSLAMLLIKCGYDVTKEFYLNDAGNQVEILARSLYIRYQQECGLNIELAVGLYPGEYLIDSAKNLKAKYDMSLLDMAEERWLELVKQFAIDEMVAIIKDDLQQLSVEHDVFVSEKKLHNDGKIKQAIDLLASMNLIYKGILTPPKGKEIEDWEEREQLLFKSSLFGDDVDRPLQKSDGSWTYFAAELAYLKDKIDRGFKSLIIVLGVDHGGYVKRTKAAVKALSNGEVEIDIKLYQHVNLYQNGDLIKMSKRAGNYVSLREVNDAVGKDAIRFMMLTRKNDMIMDFDLEKTKEQTKDNPVFYVQYAHARCYSIMRNAQADLPESYQIFEQNNFDLQQLNSPDELELVKFLASWPKLIESASYSHEPHKIVFFLQDLAALLHGLWHKGKENKDLRFILRDNIPKTAARLALLKAVTIVIASGFTVLNIKPVYEM